MSPRRWVIAAAAIMLLPTYAFATKVDVAQRLLADGKCAEAVKKVDDWEKKDQFGAEDYDLRRIRSEAAFCQAKASDTLDGWRAFVARFADWPDAAEAKTRLFDLAFSAAQLEGSAAGMLAYIGAYPDSPHVSQARLQEEAWAFEDAAKSGDPKAIERFLQAHPRTTMREQAWEAMVQTTPGIYLITPAGEPQRIEPLTIGDGEVVELPSGLPVVEAFPVIGVNQPGAGRGETSEWWTLQAVVYDSEGVAHLTDQAPIEAVLSERLGVGPAPKAAGLLDLVAAPGSHLARVATSRNPLSVAKHCQGFARFALTLRSPGTTPVAYPFAVDCPTEDGVATPLGLLIGAMDAAEAGQRAVARQRYDALVARNDAAGLNEWLQKALPRDPVLAVSDDHPGVGDWVVWTRAADGSELTRWIRVDGEAVRVIGMRQGWMVATDTGLATAANAPTCPTPAGSLGITLFCSDEGKPRPFALLGDPLGWDLPSDADFAASGVVPPPELEQVTAVQPRWQGGLRGVWTVKIDGRVVDVVADAPLGWTKAINVPPPLAAWLDTNASGVPIGLSLVGGDAWAAWRAFGG